MSGGNSATIYAAFLGASAAALFQYLVGRSRNRRRRNAALKAIVAEVSVLAELVRVQYRPQGLSKLGRAIAQDPETRVFPIDLGGKYFTVYEALSAQLGYLKEDHAATVVQFYTLYKVAIALASPNEKDTDIDGPMIDQLLDLAGQIAAFRTGSSR